MFVTARRNSGSAIVDTTMAFRSAALRTMDDAASSPRAKEKSRVVVAALALVVVVEEEEESVNWPSDLRTVDDVPPQPRQCHREEAALREPLPGLSFDAHR